LEEENEKEESRNDEEESENSPRENQKERTPLSVSCYYSGFVFLVYF